MFLLFQLLHLVFLFNEGGLRWYRSYDNFTLPIYELDYKYLNTTFEEVMSDIDEWIARTLESIAELKRKIKSGELD